MKNLEQSSEKANRRKVLGVGSLIATTAIGLGAYKKGLPGTQKGGMDDSGESLEEGTRVTTQRTIDRQYLPTSSLRERTINPEILVDLMNKNSTFKRLISGLGYSGVNSIEGLKGQTAGEFQIHVDQARVREVRSLEAEPPRDEITHVTLLIPTNIGDIKLTGLRPGRGFSYGNNPGINPSTKMALYSNNGRFDECYLEVDEGRSQAKTAVLNDFPGFHHEKRAVVMDDGSELVYKRGLSDGESEELSNSLNDASVIGSEKRVYRTLLKSSVDGQINAEIVAGDHHDDKTLEDMYPPAGKSQKDKLLKFGRSVEIISMEWGTDPEIKQRRKLTDDSHGASHSIRSNTGPDREGNYRRQSIFPSVSSPAETPSKDCILEELGILGGAAGILISSIGLASCAVSGPLCVVAVTGVILTTGTTFTAAITYDPEEC